MKELINPLVRRYIPNSRFVEGAFKDTFVCNPSYEDFGESITDKESYKLSLAGHSLGGASSVGLQSGSYAFPDGKYVSSKDISSILRPDLSPVEVDEIIQRSKESLESYDERTKVELQKQLENVSEQNNKSSSEASE